MAASGGRQTHKSAHLTKQMCNSGKQQVGTLSNVPTMSNLDHFHSQESTSIGHFTKHHMPQQLEGDMSDGTVSQVKSMWEHQ